MSKATLMIPSNFVCVWS